ncbi:hypothetical protein J4G48_0031605 [Bradyrhizobium barranii subsp. apii]|uniref:hypothetical protein n=1 Tax=Bradyrhizobium barranii TaxID=2992140 RepID=UPI001CD76175|nr:hypothetical protein [Bradyrhizobium barranii]UPT93858.1 hypothetical protein J4G48_0031605 [Bradyrhizobium barranii subsp. apii]
MTALNSYSTGTVAVSADGTTVTGTSTIWASAGNVKPGDLFQSGHYVVPITDVTDDTHLVITPWPGSTLSGASYTIWKVSQQRIVGETYARDVDKIVGALNTSGFFVFVDINQTVPDPSLGDDGQYAFQPTTGKTWVKAAGVWTFLGIYKGLRFRGAYDNAATYSYGDVQTTSGSSYIYIYINATPSAGHTAPNATYWQVLAAKGDPGATGPTGAGYGGTSTTSLLIGTGSKVFTTQAGLAYTNGARVRASATAGATGWVEGVATYSGTTLTITSDKTSGSGTGTAWNLNLAGEPGVGDLSSANNLSDLTNKLTSTNNLQAVSFGGGQSLNAAQKTQAQINAGVRTVLTASANYYVNGSTGSDSNDGLSSGAAFATLQKAMDVIAALDCSTFDLAVNVANGTYAALVLKSYLGSGAVTFQGNNASPSSVVISASGAALSTTAVGGRFTVSGFRVQSSTAQDVAVSSATSVTLQNMEYNGSSANFRIYANSGGLLTCAGASHKVLTGGIGLFLVGDGAAKLTTSSSTFTFGANVTYSGATFTARRFGYCECPSMTFTLGGFTVTGQRHAIAQCSGTAGAGVSTFFPGTVGGTTDATSFFG